MQTNFNAQIKILITAINKKVEAHEIETKKLVQTRGSLQLICKHEFEPKGSDHNYTYENCKNCGLTQKQ